MKGQNKKVAVGLSGGVDSAVAAAKLVDKGYKVTGVFLECWKAPGCRTDEDRRDALSVALRLKIPFKVLDFRKEYKARVVDYFYKEYKAGRTPNPDTMCNREIKFGLFYEWCLKNGFDYIGTGHYARIRERSQKSEVGRIKYDLLRGGDEKKDQSYFLYLLRQEQLGRILFPIGEMTKKEVRQEAKKRKLPVADKPDSQGICFIGPVDVKEFLKEKIKPEKGLVVDTKGNVIGEHEGVWYFTIGQRGGWRLKSRIKSLKLKIDLTRLPPLYVMEKDVENNRLVVGTRREVMRDSFEVEEIQWVNEDLRFKIQKLKKLSVKIRHQGKLIEVRLVRRNLRFLIQLAKPAFGVASGQAAVFYQGDVVLGGGVIV